LRGEEEEGGGSAKIGSGKRKRKIDSTLNKSHHEKTKEKTRERETKKP
jgi:hypothetical protein